MEAYCEIRVILSYLATGTISQLWVYICLHSQVYAGAIVMLTGVHTCEKVWYYYLWVVPPDRYCLSLAQPQFVSNCILNIIMYIYITLYRMMQLEINWFDWLIDWFSVSILVCSASFPASAVQYECRTNEWQQTKPQLMTILLGNISSSYYDLAWAFSWPFNMVPCLEYST